MRAEGTTELTGDLIFSCSFTGTSTTASVTVFSSAPVTSKVITSVSGVTPVGAVEAALFVCSSSSQCQTGGGAGPVYATIPSANQLLFTNVGITATGTLYFRVANIRVNTSAVTLSSTLTTVTEQALVAENDTSSAFASGTTVGYVFPSLQATTLRANPFGSPSPTITNYTTCQGNVLSATTAIKASYLVEVKGLFAGAFKLIKSTPGSAGEGGTFIPGDGTGAGAATSPTEIQLAFANVPAGVTLYLPTTVSNNGLSLTAVDATGSAVPASTAAGAPGVLTAGTTAAPGTYGTTFLGSIVTESNGPTAAFTPSSGTVTVTYAVAATDKTNSSEVVDIPVYVVVPTTITGAQSAITVLEGYAPQAAAATATTIPNFAVQTASPVATTSIGLCQTSLMFPFVTNQLGFDTGIALANTSSDPFGTTTGAGTCLLNFYGTGAPTPSTGVAAPGGAQAAGTVNAFLLSAVAPAFQGYMIVTCNFVDAYGYAFLAYNLTQNNGAVEGYIAPQLQRTSGDVAILGK